MILQDAQSHTPAVSPARIDAELNVSLSPGLLKNGKLSTAKKRQRDIVNFSNRNPSSSDPDQSRLNTAERIVLARMHPSSEYNQRTGGKWAIAKPVFGSGRRDKGALFWAWVRQVAARMVKARHSSTHFLQAGFIFARDMAVSSPLFKNRFRAKSPADVRNPLNKLDPRALGDFRMTNPDSAVFSVTAENNVGENGSNAVLDRKHRTALIKETMPHVNAAIARETVACQAELDRRITEGLEKFNQQLK